MICVNMMSLESTGAEFGGYVDVGGGVRLLGWGDWGGKRDMNMHGGMADILTVPDDLKQPHLQYLALESTSRSSGSPNS